MKISNPELKVVRFNADDVIATSVLIGKTGLFYVDNGNGGYNSFNGTFSSFDGSVYGITGIYAEEKDVGDDRSGLLEMADFYTMGVTIPMVPVMESIAKQAYDANFDGNNYHSDGVSYFERYWNQ